MALAELKQKIKTDAETLAKKITDEAKAEAEKIIDKARDDLARLTKQVEKDGDQLANERYQNIVTLARVSGKNKVLGVRQKLVDDVFSQVLDRMKQLTGDKFRDFARNILSHHPPGEDTKLMVGSKMRDMIDRKFVDDLNNTLKTPGKFILADPDRDFEYGFYLVTDWIEIDLTYNGIIRTVREEMEMDVINILFEKG
jgi:V/A-type H+/Na+-transporting ATPase subunit E